MECARSEPWRLGLCWQLTILYSCSLRSWPFLSWSSRSRIPVGHLLLWYSLLISLLLWSPFSSLFSQYSKPVPSSINTMWATYWILNFIVVKKWKMSKQVKWASILLFNISKIFKHLINVKIKYFTFFFCSSSLTFGMDFTLRAHLNLD